MSAGITGDCRLPIMHRKLDQGRRLKRQAGYDDGKGRTEPLKRPYNAPGIGWLLAAIAGVVAVLAALNVITGIANLTYWLIALLALAILL